VLASDLETTGLSSAEAAARLRETGPNEIASERRLSRARVLWNQLRSPLQLLLFLAIAAAAASGEWLNAAIVLAIVLLSAAIGYAREYRAQVTLADLRARVAVKARVLRDGTEIAVPAREVVPGDIVLLSAGNLVPADAELLQATDCFVNEAVLTGESFPVEKRPAPVRGDPSSAVFLGTNVRSGMAVCRVMRTGRATRFGTIAQRLSLKAPDTEFERGIRRFGYLLMATALVMVVLVFAANALLGRALIDTLLFAVALAVGLSPELLPAILTVNLARGAQNLAAGGVLVRRLNAIENLGSIDVLCTDKTGTLTEGVVTLENAYDPEGLVSDRVLELGASNAALQTGFANPLDGAILQARGFESGGGAKLGEVPYDFVRKRMSVIVRAGDAAQLITKGAVENVLELCAKLSDGRPLDGETRASLLERFRGWSAAGMRVLAIATRTVPLAGSYGRETERDLEFAGFLVFADRPKAGVTQALADLARLGVSVKVITGDVELVARYVAQLVGLPHARVLSGHDLDDLNDEALWHAAEKTDLFVAVDPNQKERIILALRKMGHVVGFLGDGVNDAPAMHAADTSLSVESAVDVARDAADFVLLDRDLDVIRRGIEEGRRTFANTMKYLLMTMSANLGNMVSMAVASLLLDFLPLLASQVLLNNFLSDIPAIGLAGDAVDPELIARPRRWNIAFVGRFMVSFGLLSSLFDFLTFAVLIGLFASGVALFRTGWFVESLITELAVALVVRTRRVSWRSRPSPTLLVATALVAILAFVIPYLPFAPLLGFVPLPAMVLAALVAVTGLYVACAELMKQRFYRNRP
jgi:Mg2+-importing ATPase